jgi:hypothetical protein
MLTPITRRGRTRALPAALVAVALPALAAVVLLILIGCDGDQGATSPPDPTPVMDLAVGHTWFYRSRINQPGEPFVDVTRTIVEHLEIPYAGRTITVAHEQVQADQGAKFLPGNSRLLRNQDGGLYCYGAVAPDGMVEVHDPTLVAPRNAQPGERFFLGPDLDLVCVAVDSLVATDFGEVTADVFQFSLMEGTVMVPDVYLVPGVGLTRYYSLELTETLVGYAFE